MQQQSLPRPIVQPFHSQNLQNELQNALQLINNLLSELKKLDDKQMLTEAHLTESRIHHALQNVPKGLYIYIYIYMRMHMKKIFEYNYI